MAPQLAVQYSQQEVTLDVCPQKARKDTPLYHFTYTLRWQSSEWNHRSSFGHVGFMFICISDTVKWTVVSFILVSAHENHSDQISIKHWWIWGSISAFLLQYSPFSNIDQSELVCTHPVHPLLSFPRRFLPSINRKSYMFVTCLYYSLNYKGRSTLCLFGSLFIPHLHPWVC